jgi:acylphosphatase
MVAGENADVKARSASPPRAFPSVDGLGPGAVLGYAPPCETMSEHKALHVWVSGRVQGVWFRASTEAEARRLDLTGWVRNRTDGRVEAWFEGAEESLGRMLAWCRRGPELARVDDLQVEKVQAEGVSDFQIRPTV